MCKVYVLIAINNGFINIKKREANKKIFGCMHARLIDVWVAGGVDQL